MKITKSLSGLFRKKDRKTPAIPDEPSQNSTEHIVTAKDKKTAALQRYYDCLEQKNGKGMEQALYDIRENCSQKNSYCLTEVFCPECPFGGCPVISGRAGL